ncbi:K02A2.6-like [Cordylochernes scorpioides]|uniref:K02A2.6-like n=1 Tax=Cordylochernes scorpioides TaxID=51811 RepID=A0ABY6KTJ0_9ARAC|nr:K02A2.6-like [Cordylochernes scorpioides]
MNVKKEGTQVSNYVVQHLPRNPSIFSGEDGEDLQKWLKGYARVAKYNHWDETLCLTKEFTSQLENVFGKKENSKLQAEKKLKTRAQLKGESTECYIQDVLCLCKEVDPQMSEEDKISHLMKGIAEELYQALLPRDVQSTEQFITECRRVEALRCRRVTPTRYERLPNVASLCDKDDGKDLSSLIRQIVREEVQRALGSPREEPKNATIEEIVKEEIGRTLAPISKSRRSPPHKERPRQIQGLNPLEYSKMQHEERETPQGEYHFKHIRNPSIFSGEPGQSSEKWLKEYHRVARYNCWDSSMCLANVFFFLSGTAKVWFENVEEQITSWELFETMLSQAFGHYASEKDQLLEKLKARAQGKGESNVLYLCRQINPNMNEKVAHLVKGVSEEIYRAIVTFEIATTEEFIKWCRKIELSQKKRVNTRIVFDRLPNAAAINPAESESMEDLIRRIVREEIQPALNPEPATHKPSSLDLIIREEVERNLSAISQPIPLKTKRNAVALSPIQSISSPPKSGKLMRATETGGKAADESRNPPPIITANMKRNYVVIIINGQNVEALVDSGADYSVISESFRRYLKIPFFAEKGPVLRVANRQHIETLGRCNLKVSIEKLEIYFTFVVFSECSHHIILGLDFFRATSAVIYCGKGEIHLKESVNEGLEEDLPTHALEDCFIPARSIKKITVINEDIRGGKDLMIKGSKDLILKKELVIPSSIINFHHGRGEIWVTNGTSQNQIIPAGMLVGYLRKIGSSGIYSVDTAEDDKTQSNIKSEDRRQQILSLVDERLDKEQKSMIADCLEKYSEVFDFERKSFSTTSNVKHKIDTSDSRPIKQRPYRVSPVEKRAIQTEVDKMIKMGIVQPSESPWSSPVVLVKKKDGSWRFCVDYRKLNKVTKKDVYPLPRNDDVLDSLTGAKFFSSMDLLTGYWQIEIDEEDREKTAFITPDGLYEFRVMPFGLCNAPATFERMMDKLLAGLKWTICLCYLNDIIVYATSFKEHIERLGKVLRCIQQAGLCINHEKCRFGSREIKVLGHLVTESGIRPDPDKIEAITNFPTPKTATEVRSFMGLCSYYKRFVKDFANKAKPLHDLLRNNVNANVSLIHKTNLHCPHCDEKYIGRARLTSGEPSQRFRQQEQSFQILKSALTTDPVLGHFKEDAETLVHTDASGYGVGAVLTQLVEGKEKPIAYASRTLNAAERNYSTTERECLAVVWAIYKFRPYLFGKHFTVVSDHHSLCWLANKIGIDFLGRFPTSNDGNKWTVVATDYLTRYAMTKAIPNVSSEEVGKCIVEDRIDFRPRSNVYISHNTGDNNLCGTAHRFTSAYHPQTNGLTERLNKTLVLPYVTFAYNTAKQETTGFSPFYLVHGRDVETPLDTILTYREEANLEDYVECLVTNAEDARQLARLNILKAQEKDKSRYDKSHRPVQYRAEDPVWVYTPVRKQGLSEKLLKRYFGPYKFVRQLSEVTYEVEALERRPRQRNIKDIVHVLRMKPYRSPEEQTQD